MFVSLIRCSPFRVTVPDSRYMLNGTRRLTDEDRSVPAEGSEVVAFIVMIREERREERGQRRENSE